MRDEALAQTLVDAGAELVDSDADADIGTDAPTASEAPCAIVSLSAAQGDGGGRLVRAGRRGLASATVRTRAALVARRLRRWYPDVGIVAWDIEQRVAVGEPARSLSLAERLPQRSFVVARRTRDEPTLLEAIVEEAARTTGRPLTLRAPLLRAGAIVSPDDDSVLRVAVGPGRIQVLRQLEALETLNACDVREELARLIPWPLADGRLGLGEWSLEERLPGSRPPELTATLIEDCTEFLAELFQACGGAGERRLAEQAAYVAHVVGPERTRGLTELADSAETALANVPRGFGHGDFWAGNLLVGGDGRLTGVIDWDSGGPGRLPFVDVLHLWLSDRRGPAPEQWGPALVEHLLPWADGADHAVAERYAARIGVELSEREREALVVAYWLDHVSHQLHYLDRDTRPAWLRNNVDHVLHAFRQARPGAVAAGTVERVVPSDAEWDALAGASRNVFSTRQWASVWRRHFGSESADQTFLGCRDASGALVAVVPLETRRRGTVQVTRFLGHGPADQLGAVCAPEHTAQAARVLGAALGHGVFVGDRVRVDQDWPLHVGGRSILEEKSPAIETEGLTWDAFLATRSSNLRQQVRRRERKLAAAHSLEYRLADSAERLDADLDLLFSLHRARWPRGTDFGTARHEAFHRELAKRAFELGWLRLWFLELDGTTRAAWYGFRFEGVESYYQAGRDPDWDQASVGFVLLCHSIRSAFEDGMREYRFLRGDEGYKFRFATSDGALETIVAGRGVTGRAIARAAAGAAGGRMLTPVRGLLGRLL